MYLLINNWSYDYECGEQIKLYDDYKKANNDFKKQIDEIKDDGLLNIVEDEENYFSTYDDGEYLMNHSTVEIRKIEVEK